MKRKAFGILLSLTIMLTFIVGSAPAALAADCPNVRVKLTIGTTTQFSFQVSGNYNANGTALTNGGVYTVKLENGDSVNLYDSNGQQVCTAPSPNATLVIKGAGASYGLQFRAAVCSL
jgi:hypothetical protein